MKLHDRSLVLIAALLVATLSIATGSAAAQPTAPEADRAQTTGRVIDAESAEGVARAVVRTADQEVFADGEGHFRLQLEPGRWVIEVEADGYLPSSTDLEIGAAGFSDIVVELTQAHETIVVSGRMDARAGPATLPLLPEQVMSQAGAIDNVFRSLQTLPGVAAPDEFGSRISVRGGGPDQNLTVMDGVEIHNPYRLFGLVSAFNPETVDDFTFSTGAFSARHGDRLSSLLEIDNRSGTEARPFAGSTSFSITDANVILEGQLPGSAPGSWLVTGRRTYYDLIAESFVDADLPSFADLQAKVSREIGTSGRLSLTGLRSRESTDGEFTEDNSPEFANIFAKASNDLVALSFDAPMGDGSASTVASYYSFSDVIDFDGQFESDRSSNSANPDLAEVIFVREVEVRDLALRQEFVSMISARHQLEYGFEIHRLDTRWGWDIPAERNLGDANGSSINGGAALPEQLDSRVKSIRLGAWLSDRFRFGSRLLLEPGLRVDRSTINRRAIVSPRLAAQFEINHDTQLRAAIGFHSQSPGYEKTFQNDYFVDLTDARDIDSERSTHYIVGVEQQLQPGLSLKVDAYYKDFSDLIVGRLETEDERMARIARYEFPPPLQDSIPTEAQITSIAVNGSRGRAYGIDVFLAKRATSSSTRLEGWISYTWAKADRNAYGRVYPFDYDRRHALSLVGSYRITEKLDVAITARFATGFAFTPARGVRVSSVEDPLDPERLVPRTDVDGNLVYEVDPGGPSTLNTDRLPYYARIDARATFKPGGRWLVYAEVINLLNRTNVAQFAYDILFDPVTGQPFLGAPRAEGSIPLLPTVGVRFRF